MTGRGDNPVLRRRRKKKADVIVIVFVLIVLALFVMSRTRRIAVPGYAPREQSSLPRR